MLKIHMTSIKNVLFSFTNQLLSSLDNSLSSDIHSALLIIHLVNQLLSSAHHLFVLKINYLVLKIIS